VINLAAAAVGQRIFTLYDHFRAEADRQDARAGGRPCPDTFVRKGPTKAQPIISWSPSTVRAGHERPRGAVLVGRRILRGRLTFTPHVNWVSGEVDGYDFEGPTRFDKLFTGIAVERPNGVDVVTLGSQRHRPRRHVRP
jgi:hypothetical protein